MVWIRIPFSLSSDTGSGRRKSTRTVNTTATLKTTGAKANKEYLIALLVPVTMLSTKHDVAVLPRYAETTRHI